MLSASIYKSHECEKKKKGDSKSVRHQTDSTPASQSLSPHTVSTNLKESWQEVQVSNGY